MIIRIRKKTMILMIGVVLIGIACCFAIPHIINLLSNSSKGLVAGGKLHSSLHYSAETVPAISQVESIDSERFQRPSKESPYPNPYSFKDFQKQDDKSPLISNKFDNPEDLILAYYGILQEASNMLGYSGGCGTIGLDSLPYPYAYELLTKNKKKEVSLKQFEDSFKGIGYTTLLKMIQAYAPTDTSQNTKYYMVEIEVITGAKASTDEEYNQGSQFAYYYGLITVEKSLFGGWKIKDIDYIPEDFLCAPTHGWFYLSDAIVQIVYNDNLKLIDKIDKIEEKGDMIYIYASGNGKNYRFDFVRLTNGYDILLHEYIINVDNGTMKEVNLLTDNWEGMKLTINNSQLQASY